MNEPMTRDEQRMWTFLMWLSGYLENAELNGVVQVVESIEGRLHVLLQELEPTPGRSHDATNSDTETKQTKQED